MGYCSERCFRAALNNDKNCYHSVCTFFFFFCSHVCVTHAKTDSFETVLKISFAVGPPTRGGCFFVSFSAAGVVFDAGCQVVNAVVVYLPLI